MTGNEIVRRDATDSWVDLMGPVGQLATQIARTAFVPKAMQGQPASVAAAILTGREMGLGPLTSLRGIDVIEGRPSLTSEMLAARIFAAGHRIEWRAVTDERVTVKIERGDGLSEAEVTWTMRDAQRAGLAGKSVWQKYPRALLRARALSECAQLVCPDVSLGLDVVASVDAPTAPSGTTTVVQVAPNEPKRDVIMHAAEQIPASYSPVTPSAVDENVSGTVPEVERNSNETVTEPEPNRMVTRPQMRKIGALLGDYERAQGQKIVDRDERRRFIAQLAGINPDTLASANDLTTEQASAAIDALTDMLAIGSELVVDDQGVIQ